VPLVGAFVGGTSTCDNYCNVTSSGGTVTDMDLTNRPGQIDMLNDTGTTWSTWYGITSQLPWASDTNDSGGNSFALGDKNFINSRPGRAVVASLAMFPANLGQSYTYNGLTTSTCDMDPHSSSTSYNADYVCMMEGVNGAFNSDWYTLGQSIVADHLNVPQYILRVGWECGGNWYPWSAYVAGEANYAKYFQLIVQNIRSGITAAGQTPQVKFAWNCGMGVDWGDSSHPDNNYASAALPGYPNSPNQYVDYIDFDPYDGGNGGFGQTLGDWNTTTVGTVSQVGSLAWWSNYAGQHNMYLGFTEWGTSTDDPTYIQEVFNFIYAKSGSSYINRVAYADYEQGIQGSNWMINSGKPNAFNTYQNTFVKAPEGVLPY